MGLCISSRFLPTIKVDLGGIKIERFRKTVEEDFFY
jgi:hypothetical protein